MNSDYSNKMQSAADMYRENAADMYQDYYAWNDRTYPEIYSRVSPHIKNAVEALGDRRNLTDEEINMLTERILAESNIMSNPPERHNRETIFDFIKLLLIKELEELENMGDLAVPAINPYDYPYPYSYPYHDDWWWFPFAFGGGHGHRGFGRGHFGGGHRRY